ncbi:MAG: UDP-N-acetylmuramoyl-L-alanyl-D-glutamate--2,6-diaminopimelate ligase [Desulfobacterales bacterium]|nr:UDP-N-acetylmuramoyl-L-alanyl-D-glutamate--2,6-diaminopimelate ligase [Desulfobacterales bacterium]
MKLSVLIDAMEPVLDLAKDCPDFPPEADAEISAIHYRSDAVGPGGMFVAIKGLRTDGHQYVADAIARGAAAVVAEEDVPAASDFPVIRVKNARKALALSAAHFYGNPAEQLVMIGITGTNGKTTVAFLIEKILESQHMSAGVIGTINYRYGGEVFANPLTTPEAPELQQILSNMRDAGVTHVVMEVSSHGIALDRIYGCLFDVGVFTNLSQDHLDFHQSMAAYWQTKKRLFTDYLRPGKNQASACAVINTMDPKGREVAEQIYHCPVITVGAGSEEKVYPIQTAFDQTGIQAEIQTPAGVAAINSELVGGFNLENILCAVGAGLALSLPLARIADGISAFKNVPGRLERISDASGRHVFVDYAHTPKALENVLETLRAANPGRLICIFGCGGDRDPDKRPKMGEIAGRLSDLVVITSDNPRTEAPLEIIEAIRRGTQAVLPRQMAADALEQGWTQTGYVVEPDRKRAIYLGLRAAKPGDTVLIAGKGHETYQIVGNRVLDFDDRQIAKQGLSLN